MGGITLRNNMISEGKITGPDWCRYLLEVSLSDHILIFSGGGELGVDGDMVPSGCQGILEKKNFLKEKKGGREDENVGFPHEFLSEARTKQPRKFPLPLFGMAQTQGLANAA